MKNILLSIMVIFALSFMSCDNEMVFKDAFYPFSTDFPKDGMTIEAAGAHIEISSTSKQLDGSVCPMEVSKGGDYKHYSYGDYDYKEGDWFKISCNRHSGWCYVDIEPNESGKERTLMFSLSGTGRNIPDGYKGWADQVIKITQKAE